MEQRKLYRSRSNRMIAGVCGGLAEYFGIDATLVRLAAVAALVLGVGSIGLVYLIMAVVVPEEPLPGTPGSGVKGGSAGEGPDAPTPPEPPAPFEPVAPPPPAEPAYQPPPPAEARVHRPSPGATVGIVLIVLGIVFLAGQFIPLLAWWRLWPLIIVVAGFVQMVTPGKEGWSVARLSDGLVTVAWGLLFLAITTNVVGWSVFARLFALWPVLLIAIGFELLGKAIHSSWIRALGSVVVIAALAYAVAMTATGNRFELLPSVVGSSGDEMSFSRPVGDVDEAELSLEVGVANVSLTAGDDLVSAEGDSPWSRPKFSAEESGDTAQVRLSTGESGSSTWWPGRRGGRIDAELSDEVVWDMDISLGVSNLVADFSDVRVRNLMLSPGVADCEVTLGDVPQGVGEATAVIEAGISKVTIRVPEDAEVRVESGGGLTAHDIGGQLERVDGGVWETPGFGDASRGGGVWIIRSESGIGSIVVDSY